MALFALIRYERIQLVDDLAPGIRAGGGFSEKVGSPSQCLSC